MDEITVFPIYGPPLREGNKINCISPPTKKTQIADWLSAPFPFSTDFLNIPYRIQGESKESSRYFFAYSWVLGRETAGNQNFVRIYKNAAAITAGSGKRTSNQDTIIWRYLQ